MEEIFDIVDINGNPTGETVARSIAHEKGIRHHTSHVWLVRNKNNSLEILLQKRAENKDSFPGCYDISSAGHIPAGDDYIESALRELKEELGLTARPDDLLYCGQCCDYRELTFYGKPFIDNQVSNIYMMWCDKETSDFILQTEEISEVIWMDLHKCMLAVAQNSIPHCIRLNELQMVKTAARNSLQKEMPKYPSLPVCAECKGHCCNTLGCSLSPEDLIKALNRTTYTREAVLDILKNGNFAIDSFGYGEAAFYFMRMKHKCFTFIGVDAMGECIASTENGCLLSYEDRPKGGKFLEAKSNRQCEQHYTREEMLEDWAPYQPVLASIWEEYYQKFTEDGTFDACENAYMDYQKEKMARFHQNRT